MKGASALRCSLRTSGEYVLMRDFIHECLYHPKLGYFRQSPRREFPAETQNFTRENGRDESTSPQASYGAKNTRESPVGQIKDPIEFNSLLGYADYQSELRRKYQSIATTAWLTPAEIFQPYYAHALGRRVIEAYRYPDQSKEKERVKRDASVRTGSLIVGPAPELSQSRTPKPLVIVELGAGNGTLAKGILEFLKREHSDVYRAVQYYAVEVGETSVERQRQTLDEYIVDGACTTLPKSALELERADFTQKRATLEGAHVHVLATELLDNLPHDCVAPDPVTSEPQQTWVKFEEVEISHATRTGSRKIKVMQPRMYRAPLDDALICRALALWRRCDTDSSLLYKLQNHMKVLVDAVLTSQVEASQLYVPTGAVKLLDVLHATFLGNSTAEHADDEIGTTSPLPPAAEFTLTFADFHYLPQTIGGSNSPLVQRLLNGVAQSYIDLERAPAFECDIMFATDFLALQNAFQHVFGCSAAPKSKLRSNDERGQVVRSPAFLRRYADCTATETLSGYNPMLEEFYNTSVFLAPTICSQAARTAI